MDNDRITALAREYAEEEAKGTAVESLPDGFKENVIQRNADHFEKHLRWLTRRYCLVEKSKVEEEYHEAKFTCGNVDPCSETFATSLAQKSVLERLFPDLTWPDEPLEVEIIIKRKKK